MGVPLEHRGGQIVAATKRTHPETIQLLMTALSCEPEPAMRKLIALCLRSLHAEVPEAIQLETLDAALDWSLKD
jgi:hypothetical protein